jgi:serine/threonine-protein kinase RsbW
MLDQVSISLPCKSEYVSITRLSSSVIANQMGFDIEAIEDIKVAVGEACNNAIIHSHCEATFDITFQVMDQAFVCEVTDGGNGFNLNEYQEPNLSDPQGNGLGIFIMKSLMDEVIVDTLPGKGTKITLKKFLE